VSRYLRVGDRKERRKAIERIRESRISQLDVKHFKETMRKLETQEKLLEIREARLDGRRAQAAPRTQEEEERLQQQQHVRADQMSDAERAKLDEERNQMWSSIPPHLRFKAEALLKGH
jgi:hypothetical protein